MANYSRWDDVKKKRREPTAETRAGVEQDLALGQLIYDLRAGAGLSQRELAALINTTASVICRLEDADYEGHSLSMLRRIAAALNRRVEIRFPPIRHKATSR